MVFDFAESVTVAVRHIVAELLTRKLTFSFDIADDLWVQGDVQATAKGLHRLLVGTLDLLCSGMIVITAAAAKDGVAVHIASVGTTADDVVVSKLLESLSLTEQPAGPTTRIATGACPIMGAEIRFVCDRTEGFTLDALLPYPIAAVGPLLPSAHGALLWLMTSRTLAVERIRRRFQRFGWRVVMFRGGLAPTEGRTLLPDETPALVVALETHATLSSAIEEWLKLPFPAATQRVLGVPLGNHCLSKTPDPAWSVHPVPFSPRDLALLTAAQEPGFNVDTLSSQLFDEPVPIPRLLVIDDNPTNRILASAVASVLGYEAELAENGHSGWQACLRNAPAAVVMDVNMPVMDGIEATRRIRAAQKRGEVVPFPIIGATAATDLETVQACRGAGMDVVLHKPLDVQELAAQLRRLCLTAPRNRGEMLQ